MRYRYEMQWWCRLAVVALGWNAAACRGEIVRWDDGMVIPGTQGITPAPGVVLEQRDLFKAELSFADLTHARLQGANLTEARFWFAKLAGADFTGAEIRNADFSNSAELTKEQLYATASYQRHDLRGVALDSLELAGWNFNRQNFAGGRLNSANLIGTNFAGADLTDVDLYAATIRDSNFTDANLANVTFSFGALTGSNFTRADLRGSIAFQENGVVTANMIRANGQIDGLSLGTGDVMLIRDHDGRPNPFGPPAPPVAISIRQRMEIPPGSTLRMIASDDAWGSLISFQAGIPVQLGGTLQLSLEGSVDPAQFVGRSFRLFDWTGVSPAGTFQVSSPYVWDTSRLYTTGEVALQAVPEPGCSALASMIVAAVGVVARRKLR